MDISEEQWQLLRPFIPDPEKIRTSPKGGRPWRDPRDVLNGVLRVLRTGAPWADMPRRYPPYSTCYRRFQRWVKEGVLERLLRGLAEDLKRRGKLDLTEAFIDEMKRSSSAKPLEAYCARPLPRSWSATAATTATRSTES